MKKTQPKTPGTLLKTAIALGFIIALGFLLRITLIDKAPKGALIDEAHFGYIAYSLLQTGKDEHGISYPLIFKGFGDQKLPGYAYAMVPVVKLFGLSNASIRIPSILAGTFLILVMFFIIRELGWGDRAALLAAAITAIIPWSFFLSRFGFESNLALFVYALGLLTLLHAVNLAQQKLPAQRLLPWLMGAGFFLGLTWYCYIAYRPVVFALSLAWLFVLRLQKKIRVQHIAVFAISMVITILPLFSPAAVGSNTTRFNQVGITHDEGIISDVNEMRAFCSFRLPKILCYAALNKYLFISEILFKRLVYTFTPQYLATAGEEGLFFLAQRGYGQMYFGLYVFFVVGVVFLIGQFANKKLDPKWRWFLLLGLLIAPIPALLVGEPQKVRLTPILPFIILVTVWGIESAISFIKNQKVTKLFLAIGVGTITLAAGAFYLTYFSIHTVKYDYTYQSYVPELMRYLHDYSADSQIYIKPFFSDPLMFYAYYNVMDPAEYQRKAILGELESSGFQHTVGLGNLHVKDDSVKNIGCQAVKSNEHAFFVTNERIVGDKSYPPTKIIYSDNGALQYVFVYDATGFAQKYPELCQPK